ncbi:outer membrane protein assembly factor BamB family protein [Pseudoalteromonas rubra]|uniref:Pyrrolo-quinoline quinone repeat domain-containing protein n=1 Tax=Pseudoalteromonas rubra TaxID=43658 RepID=A0A0U3GSB8_9GAMM|nr:PQQ-binding-like beta-propeller repeat protein [Pseudoalteromonas rubra]ALU45915.1 hypothetical protein AT705_23610 [Pseudoalteromonas rubra]
MNSTKTLKQFGLISMLAVGLSYDAAQTALAASGDYLFSYQVKGENWGGITLRDHIAYFGSDDGHLYALNVDQPKLAWSYKTDGLVRSKPTIKHHQIFVSSDDGYLYALNRWQGKLLWRTSLNDADVQRILPANHAPWEFDYSKSSALVQGNKVFIGSGDGHLYAIARSSGKVLWRFKTEGKIRATPAHYQGLVFISSWDGSVYALDAKTGQRVWQYDTQGALTSSPTIVDDVLVIGSRDTHLYGLDPLSGELLWKQAYPGGSWVESSATAAADGEHFYIGSSDSNLLNKYHAQSGELIWQFETGGWSWGQPVAKNGTVYIGATGHDEPGWFATQRGFFAVDSRTGEQQWQYQPKMIDGFVHGGVYGAPAVGYGKVIVPDLDGYIHIFEE